MSTRSLIATGMVCATVVAVAGFLSNAGPLSPPAEPIAPTHKTLTEVEPRIPVNAANTPGDVDSLFKIAAPGSYYLTGNITGVSGKHGIKIEASDVTLDLSGYALIGVADSLNGINMPSVRENVVIRNGIVSSWDGAGVKAAFHNGAIEGVHARRNAGWGIDNAGSFSSRITGCSALFNGAGVANAGGVRTGNAAVVESCQARSNTGDGIVVSGISTVSGNTAQSNGGDGIVADFGSTVSSDTARGNKGDGIQVGGDSIVLNNACDNNGSGGDGAGIRAIGSDTRIEGNNVTDNAAGVEVDNAGNIIIRNSAGGNTINYDIVADNKVGVIVAAPNSTAISGSTGGAGVGAIDPWANFSF